MSSLAQVFRLDGKLATIWRRPRLSPPLWAMGLDIVLVHTGAGKINHTDAYLTDHVGMTAEATHWLLDQGIKMTGTDAVTFDPPASGSVCFL